MGYFIYFSIESVNEKAKPFPFLCNIAFFFFLATLCFVSILFLLPSISEYNFSLTPPGGVWLSLVWWSLWGILSRMAWSWPSRLRWLYHVLLGTPTIQTLDRRERGSGMDVFSSPLALPQSGSNNDRTQGSSAFSWHFQAEAVWTVACRPDCSCSVTFSVILAVSLGSPGSHQLSKTGLLASHQLCLPSKFLYSLR